ncbi:hypothetical protein Clacol_005217 [Clathrus columnatus]|uniref:F-box domain-containing protein n=1 Tax=Clathrus columnatus TaxID=1419009 RepID=A0AAV5ACX9_9AGAM|nr:hypothetical protein Clacol_005217 [Clathrus columnatus]
MPYPEGLSICMIWDDIAFYLASTKDLLSLALTCRDFKELIIPNHLEYRYISCDLRQSDAWKFIQSRPRWSKCIQSLNLLRGPLGDVRLPRALNEVMVRFKWPPSDFPFTDEDVATFKDSLSRMTSLKELTLIQSYSPSFEHFTNVFLDVLTTSATPSLEGLAVKLVPHVFLDDERVLPENGEISTWPLTSLKKVILCDSIQAAIKLTLFCPDIEDLYLSELSSASTSYIIPQANWTKLRRLSLTFRALSMPTEEFSAIMTSFFQLHNNIESLYLVLRNNLVLDPPPLSLPNLRSLTIFTIGNQFSLTSILSVESISRLVHLDCPITNADIDALQQMDNLRSLRLVQFYDLSLESLGSFLSKTPNLEKICLDTFLAPTFWSETDVEAKLVQILLQCPKLTHIFCDFPVPVPEVEDDGDDSVQLDVYPNELLENLCKSLSPLQELTYLQVRLDRAQKNVNLERDENGNYSGYQFVTLKKAGGEPRYWGDVFLHL